MYLVRVLVSALRVSLFSFSLNLEALSPPFFDDELQQRTIRNIQHHTKPSRIRMIQQRGAAIACSDHRSSCTVPLPLRFPLRRPLRRPPPSSLFVPIFRLLLFHCILLSTLLYLHSFCIAVSIPNSATGNAPPSSSSPPTAASSHPPSSGDLSVSSSSSSHHGHSPIPYLSNIGLNQKIPSTPPSTSPPSSAHMTRGGLLVIPSRIEFGPTQLLVPLSANLELRNPSPTKFLDVIGINSRCIHFHVQGFEAITLPPGAKIMVQVMFLPRTLGSIIGRIEVKRRGAGGKKERVRE